MGRGANRNQQGGRGRGLDGNGLNRNIGRRSGGHAPEGNGVDRASGRGSSGRNVRGVGRGSGGRGLGGTSARISVGRGLQLRTNVSIDPTLGGFDNGIADSEGLNNRIPSEGSQGGLGSGGLNSRIPSEGRQRGLSGGGGNRRIQVEGSPGGSSQGGSSQGLPRIGGGIRIMLSDRSPEEDSHNVGGVAGRGERVVDTTNLGGRVPRVSRPTSTIRTFPAQPSIEDEGRQVLGEGGAANGENPHINLTPPGSNNSAHAPQGASDGPSSEAAAPSAPVSNQTTTSTNRSTKLYVWVENGKKLLPSEKASNLITDSFKLRLDKSGYNWKNVSKTTKDIYFDEFKKHAYWDEGYEAAIRRAWRIKASRRYSDFVCKQRLKDQQDYMPDDVWKEWNEYWKTDEFKTKSLNGSKARAGGEDGPSKHSGGSITFRTHKERMEIEKKRKISAPELYFKVHKKRGTGEYTTPKAKRLGEQLEQALKEMEASEDPEEEVINQNELYMDIVGQPQRSRWYGVDPSVFGDDGASTSSGSNRFREMQKLIEEMQVQEKVWLLQLKELKKLSEELKASLPGMVSHIVKQQLHQDKGKGKRPLEPVDEEDDDGEEEYDDEGENDDEGEDDQ